MNLELKKLDYVMVMVMVENMSRSIEFYRDALGLEHETSDPRRRGEGISSCCRRLRASSPETSERSEVELPYQTDVFWCQRKGFV